MPATSNIVIDGSNQNNDTTRNMTIKTVSGTNTNVFPIRIVGNCTNITIKNVKVATGVATSYTIAITTRIGSQGSFSPSNITIENCEIYAQGGTGSQGIGFSNSGTNPTSYKTNINVIGNYISARARGIFCNYVGDANIINNTIYVDDQRSASMGYGILLMTGGSVNGTFNILRNKILKLKSLNTNTTSNTDYGIVGIHSELASPKVVNIINNFISGFDPVSTNQNSKYYGIRAYNSSTTNIYYNTIVFPNMTNPTNSNNYFTAINLATTTEASINANATINLLNNIIISNEPDFVVYGIKRPGTSGTVSSNYNNIYIQNGHIGYWNAANTTSLSDWQTASGLDQNSKNINLTFSNTIPWQLTSNLGDQNLAGTPISGITTDIENNPRNTTKPYMGCWESTNYPLPVELTLFTYKINNNKITLEWKTSTEINNNGFIVEKLINNKWQELTFIKGAGNSNVEKTYNFTDNNVLPGKNYYRLKQIDFNGTTNYSDILEVNVEFPKSFELYQNYPNPFNPSTTIQYYIPENGFVNITIYNSIGQKIATLVDNQQDQGTYKVEWNAINLPSGIYYCQMIFNNTKRTIKLILNK